MNLRTWHRSSAIVVALYGLAHIANHLLGFAGFAAHDAMMKVLRHVYRFPPLEALLLACVAVQVLSGWWLLVRGWRTRRGALAWVQALSGLLLSAFLGLHVAAIFFGRWQLQLDTNLYYAAAGLQSHPAELFFGPYYFLGVAAFFIHLGCGLQRLRQVRLPPGAAGRRSNRIAAVAGLAGLGIAAALVLLLSGHGPLLQVPAQYLATFR